MFCVKIKFVEKKIFGSKKFLGGFLVKKKIVKKNFFWSTIFSVKNFFWSKNFWLCTQTRVHARKRTHMQTCVHTQASFQDEL